MRLPAQARAGSAALRLSVAPCPAPEVLAPQWCALERHAQPSFFTGWTWIGCWLSHLARAAPALRPQLVRVHDGAELVGLGVVVPQAVRRLRWWPSQAVHLHATGQPALDDITVEHNGWLARPGMQARVREAIASQLWAHLPRVDQIRLPGVSAGHGDWRALMRPGMHADEASAAPSGKAHHSSEASLVQEVREHTEPAYRVDLAALRAGGQTYLDSLGPQTRASIRRSLRLYEDLGPVRLQAAGTVDEGLQVLARLKHFHQAAWQARGRAGAFGNPHFERFHEHLVRTGLPQAQVQLLRLTAGPQEVGYLYNFVQGGQVLAYQSGFHFGLTQRNHHPGLVMHALAVQQALDAGQDGYDLLAGQARYKEQLASHRYDMTTFTLHRRSLGWWLENAVRQGRARWGVRVDSIKST